MTSAKARHDGETVWVSAGEGFILDAVRSVTMPNRGSRGVISDPITKAIVVSAGDDGHYAVGVCEISNPGKAVYVEEVLEDSHDFQVSSSASNDATFALSDEFEFMENKNFSLHKVFGALGRRLKRVRALNARIEGLLEEHVNITHEAAEASAGAKKVLTRFEK